MVFVPFRFYILGYKKSTTLTSQEFPVTFDQEGHFLKKLNLHRVGRMMLQKSCYIDIMTASTLLIVISPLLVSQQLLPSAIAKSISGF